MTMTITVKPVAILAKDCLYGKQKLRPLKNLSMISNLIYEK